MLVAVSERVRAPLGWWRARGVLVRDTIGTAAFTAVAFWPLIAADGVALGELPVHAAGPLATALALAQAVPLAARRRWPACPSSASGTCSRRANDSRADWPIQAARLGAFRRGVRGRRVHARRRHRSAR